MLQDIIMRGLHTANIYLYKPEKLDTHNIVGKRATRDLSANYISSGFREAIQDTHTLLWIKLYSMMIMY